jgi:hypothetical protein
MSIVDCVVKGGKEDLVCVGRRSATLMGAVPTARAVGALDDRRDHTRREQSSPTVGSCDALGTWFRRCC